jgi:hypothetical protein
LGYFGWNLSASSTILPSNAVYILTPIFLQVMCIGQVIGGILAKDQATAQKAAKLVSVKYEEYVPILTIEVSSLIKPFPQPKIIIVVRIYGVKRIPSIDNASVLKGVPRGWDPSYFLGTIILVLIQSRPQIFIPLAPHISGNG